MLVSMLMAMSGVAVANMTQLPVVSAFAQCVTARLGALPDSPDDRQIALHGASVACREQSEASYAEGKLTLNGKPFPKAWWKEVRTLIDLADVELARAVMDAPDKVKAFDVKWELPDGTLVAVGDRYMPGTIRVRVVAA